MSYITITIGGQAVTLVSTPSIIERAAVQFDMTDMVSIVTSIFTGQTQAQKWPGADMLSGTMTLPPMTLPQSAQWLSFLRQLRGMANGFLMTDPLHLAPTGAGGGTPFADNTQNSGNPAGSEWVGTKGWPANTLVLKQGDAFSLNWRLYYTLDDVTSDGSGKALINIWPTLRETVTQDGTSNSFQNATGGLTFTAGHPLGNPGYFAQWSAFNMAPGVPLPADAVIQGIYAVFVLSNTSDAIAGASYNNLGLTLPAAPYTDTTFYRGSLGTSLDLLNGQMSISLGATLANPFNGLPFSASGVGLAIYYTSATPLIDGSMPPPFAVPSGQGLAWAMPFQSAFGPIETGDNNGTATATPASLNGAIGLTKPTGIFRLANNKRTWSADPSMITRASFQIQEYR